MIRSIIRLAMLALVIITASSAADAMTAKRTRKRPRFQIIIKEASNAKKEAKYAKKLGEFEQFLAYPRTDINKRENLYGNTALHFVGWYGLIDFLELLLRYPDLDINARDNENKTALIIAIEQFKRVSEGNAPEIPQRFAPSFLQFINFLLFHKPLPMIIKNEDMLPQMHKKHWYVMDHHYPNPYLQDNKGDTALHAAVRTGNLQLVNMVLRYLAKKQKASFLIKNNRGDNPLHEAVASGYKEIARALLKTCRSLSYTIEDVFVTRNGNRENLDDISIRTDNKPMRSLTTNYLEYFQQRDAAGQ